MRSHVKIMMKFLASAYFSYILFSIGCITKYTVIRVNKNFDVFIP